MSVLGRLEIFNSTFRWQIENFSSIDAEVGVAILSPAFDTRHPCSKKLRWQLMFYPGGYDEDSKEDVGLSLRYLSEYRVSVKYSFSILNDKQHKIVEYRPGEKFSYSKYNQHWGNNNFCSKKLIQDKKKRALVKDAIVISCTITLRKIVLDDDVYCDPDDSAKANFEKLLKSGDLSDITFKIGNRQMQLHKAIVASLSPVFFAMFQHQMKEKEESVVEITDVTYEVMEELFRYIYVRKINNIENIAGDLLVAADKYDVQGLKILCEDVLSRDINLSIENALQHLEFAVQYNTTFLKKNITKFIVNRLEEFVNKPEFQHLDGFCKGELLREMAKNKVKKIAS